MVEVSSSGVFARGSEFGVNSTTSGNQSQASIAALSGGGFVVTWVSIGPEDTEYGVFGQHYDADGSPLGDEFQIDTAIADSPPQPSVAALSHGGFVVFWASEGWDGDDSGIVGQLYDSAGMAVGTAFQANSFADGQQYQPAVTPLQDGGFVVTWASAGQDGSSDGVFGQRYDDAGAPLGAEFRINSTTANTQYDPSIAGLEGGGFVVAWASFRQDGSAWGVYGQRYDADGGAEGTQFRINTTTAQDQSQPSISALSNGGFVVTWASFGQDGSDYGVYGQRYAGNGSKVGAEFRINSATLGDQSESSVTGLSDGGFVVIWSSYAQDGSSYGVYGQRFGQNGRAIGDEFRVNKFTAGDQSLPSVAALDDGAFVVTWHSFGQDGEGNGVQGQVFGSNHLPTGQITLTGEANTGEMLTANTSALADADGMGSLSYQWMRGAAVIAGATDTSYELTEADVGARIRVMISWVDGNGTTESTLSVATAGVRYGDLVLTGTPREDTLRGRYGDDLLVGRGGDDRLIGGDGADRIVGGVGHDLLNGGAGMDRLVGQTGNDRLLGGSGKDTMLGGDGIDRLEGGDGGDLLDGGARDDKLFGQAGYDSLLGGAGNDALSGGDSADRLEGGIGHDLLNGETGKDKLFGQAGSDRLIGGAGDDRLDGGSGHDRLWGQDGKDLMIGGSENDILIGAAGDDDLRGGSGADRLDGGSGRDRLDGGGGRDTLIGGTGNDRLIGGDGADVFLFNRKAGIDVIRDFTADMDVIRITNGAGDLDDLNFRRSGENVVVEFASSKIIVYDTTVAQLHDSDHFLFG